MFLGLQLRALGLRVPLAWNKQPAHRHEPALPQGPRVPSSQRRLSEERLWVASPQSQITLQQIKAALLLSVRWAGPSPAMGTVQGGAGHDLDGGEGFGGALSWKAGREDLRGNLEVWAGERGLWAEAQPPHCPSGCLSCLGHSPTQLSPIYGPTVKVTGPPGPRGTCVCAKLLQSCLPL